MVKVIWTEPAVTDLREIIQLRKSKPFYTGKVKFKEVSYYGSKE